MENIEGLQFEKWKAGVALTSKVKQMAVNVMVKLSELNPNYTNGEILESCWELIGISKRSLQNIRSEYRREGRIRTPGKVHPNGRGKRTRLRRYNKATIMTIRQMIHAYFLREEYPTMKKLRLALNKSQDLPDFKKASFHRLMVDMKFTFAQRKQKFVLIDRADTVKWRRAYLRKIKAYRKDKRDIIYVDATRVSAGQESEPLWQERSVSGSTDAVSKESSGKHWSCIILHAGSEEGLIPECLSLYNQKNNFEEELVGENFEKWFKELLLPNIKPRSVIVLDSAPCNTIMQDQIPTIYWTTDKIREWLTGHGIAWREDLIKSELIGLVESICNKSCKYKVDSLAEEAGHEILRQPPYHGEFNPLMHVWSFVKQHIATHNGTSSPDDVEELSKEAIENVTRTLWKTYVDGAIHEEDKMWKLDDLMDEMMDKLTNFLDKSGASGVDAEAAIDSRVDEDTTMLPSMME